MSFLGDLAGGGLSAMLIYFVIVVGKLTVNSLNAYGGFMTLADHHDGVHPQHAVPSAVRARVHLRLHPGSRC